jgi:hypothetical protein
MLPSAKFRLVKALRSTIGCDAANTRTKNATADSADSTANNVMVSSSNQL